MRDKIYKQNFLLEGAMCARMLGVFCDYHVAQNATVIKFYGLPLNHLDKNKKLMDFNFTEAQFCDRCHGTIVDFQPIYEF